MTVETWFPDEELKSRVESFLIVRSGKGMINTLPPSTAPVLAFRLRGVTAAQLPDGEEVVPRMGITGLNRSPRAVHFHRQTEVLLVRFREGGIAGLVRTPMDELTGMTERLDSLVAPQLADEIEEAIDEAADGAQRIASLQSFLKARLLIHPRDPLIDEAIRRIRLSCGTLRIRDLVRDLATNPDTLEKRFRHVVGATPKLFARIVRFQSFVTSYSTQTDLSEAALRAGFYDQAHLDREFRTFTGQSPTEFFLTPRRW